MAQAPLTRIRVCGRLLVELGGRRVEREIRGRQGRLLFAYLVVNRGRPVSRDELIDAVWPFRPPSRPGAALSTLLSNLRGALGRASIEGRTELQLVLESGAWIDVEAAAGAIATAQAALSRGEWEASRDPAHAALAIAEQGFMPGHDAPWIDVRRRDLEELMLEALEVIATLGGRLGGAELLTAERAAHRLVDLAPLRESGHIALMRVAEARGNVAEGLRAFDELRRRLREELGATPGTAAQEALTRLLEASGEPAREAPVTPRAAERPAPLPPLLRAPQRARFVGRERELARLEVALERARDMPRQLALVAGDPGIGKTRLLSHFGRRAHERGALVLYGRAEEEALVSYGPFVEALRHLVANSAPEAIRRSSELGGTELRTLVPELEPPVETEPAERGPTDPELARFRLFDAIATLFVAAGEGPVVLLLDDLHWADEPTMLLLKHVLRAPEQDHLLVVVTYRDAELHRAPAVLDAVADLQRDIPLERVQIRGLAPPDVASLALDSTGHEPSPSLVRSVYEETEGNPFFVLELTRHVAETRGGVRGEEETKAGSLVEAVGLPEGVRDVIRHRLAQLDEETQRALRLGAVLGREFDVEVLERCGDVADERLVRAMEEAEQARILTEEPGRPDHLSFSHALIRATLYSEMAGPRRLRTHERVANTLEELHAAGWPVTTAEIASHHLAALPHGDADRAVSYARRAAEEATALFAYEDAAGQLEMALEALEKYLPGDKRSRASLLFDLGHAQRRSGRMPAARETFLRAIEAARELGDRQLLCRSVLGYGGGFFESAFVDETMVSLLEEGLGVVGEHDSLLSLELLSRLAKAIYYSEDPRDDGRRGALSEEALGMAERLGDPRAMLVALEARHFALTRPENLEERLETAHRIIGMGRELGDLERELLGRYFLIADLIERADTEEADREIAEYGRQTERARLALHRWYHSRFLAMRAILDGRLDDGRRLAEEALGYGQPVEPRTATMHYGAQVWLMHRLQGRLSELEEAVREFVAAYPRVPAWRLGLAHLLLEQGHVREAQDVFAEFTESRFDTIPRDAIWSTTVTLAADLIAAGLGDEADARLLYELLLPYGDRLAVTGEAIFSNGPVALYLGLLAVAMGEPEEATTHLERALAEADRMGARPFAARARYALAEALRGRGRPGDSDAAEVLVAEADATARELELAPELLPA